jgi:hypothetical protein
MSVLRRRRAQELQHLRAGGWTVQTYTLADRLRAGRPVPVPAVAPVTAIRRESSR